MSGAEYRAWASIGSETPTMYMINRVKGAAALSCPFLQHATTPVAANMTRGNCMTASIATDFHVLPPHQKLNRLRTTVLKKSRGKFFYFSITL